MNTITMLGIFNRKRGTLKVKMADDGGERRSVDDAEHANGYGDCQFKVVAGRSESDGGRLAGIRPDFSNYPETDGEHYDEVD